MRDLDDVITIKIIARKKYHLAHIKLNEFSYDLYIFFFLFRRWVSNALFFGYYTRRNPNLILLFSYAHSYIPLCFSSCVIHQ